MSVEQQPTESAGAQFIAARIPDSLKEEMRSFCFARDIKLQGFIAAAIREKLLRERQVIR